MTILKCKMCGGDIQTIDNTFGTCVSCGSKLTLPKAESEIIYRKSEISASEKHTPNKDKAYGVDRNSASYSASYISLEPPCKRGQL